MDRFWNKVTIGEPNECWEWQASLDTGGYGRFGIRGFCKSSTWERAHRVSWSLTHGGIEDGMWVLHHCDNRKCVNPDHLYLGDVKDNSRDMVVRGRARGPVGEANHHNKLTAEQVAEIRAAAPEGKFSWGQRKALAERYGVTGMTIFHIATGRTWKGSEVGLG